MSLENAGAAILRQGIEVACATESRRGGRRVVSVRYSVARVTRRPSKTFMYGMVNRELARHRSGLGIDAAAGHLGNYPYFRTDDYLAFDLDEVGLADGQQRYPEASVEVLGLEDVSELLSTGVRGSVVVCTETLRINRAFEPEVLEVALENLALLTDDGGTLILNVGDVGAEIHESEAIVERVLSRRFASFSSARYGAFYAERHSRGWPTVSLGLATLMRFLKPLRTFFGRSHRFTIYVFRSRHSHVPGPKGFGERARR